MRRKSLIAVLAALVAAVAAAPAGAAPKAAPKKVLRIGWAQDANTLNPFTGQNEEDFTIWGISWDLLLDVGKRDLGPVSGIAQKWQVSPDRKTITFHLIKNAKWSDGVPITSADVKWSLDVLGGNGALFTGYTDNVASIDTPDASTVILHMKRPDARIVGDLFIYVLPKHVWAKHTVKQLLGAYNPPIPLVGSGPYVVTDYERNRIIKMDRNPHWRGARPKYDEIQFIKYGTQDATERALRLGEVDLVREVSAAGYARLGQAPHVKTISAPTAAFTEMAFNVCSHAHCPGAQFNPAIQDRAVRQAVAYAVDRNRINQIAARGTSFVAHGQLPAFYKNFYTKPAQDYPFDPAKANQILDAAGYKRGPDGIRAKGNRKLSFNLYARSESPYTVQAAKLVAEMARRVGIAFKVQVVSTDKLTELTTQKKGGKPAPAFDTFIWGWGGDPYDPSFLLSIMTTSEIGGSSDSNYSNPEYDRLFNEQAADFDVAHRRQTIARMIGLLQRDLPYLVLTDDPALQAYRTDRIANVQRVCPEPNGDLICDQKGYWTMLTMSPPAAAAASNGGGGSTGIIVAIVLAVAVIASALIIRTRRRRRDSEPLELET